MHHFHRSILREYDIRGIVGDTLHGADAYAIGRTFASLAKEKTQNPTICVGYDGRLSSENLAAELVRGLREAGADVKNIDLGPTPMLYFSIQHLQADGGIMVTGSHNPPTHNGFKMVLGGASFYGEQIKTLGKHARAGTWQAGAGEEMRHDVKAAYLEALLGAMTGGGKDLRVGWDPGNGAAGDIVSALVKKLPGEHLVINGKIDGTFPAHHPDPTVPKNLEQLIALVKEKNLDCGLALDGDGDRLGVVSANGQILWGDQLVLLYAREIAKSHPGAVVIGDVKSSRSLFDGLKELGLSPLMWKTGHSHIKAKIKETGAKLAGEMSGHLFFADRYFGFDDGIYAGLRMLNILAHETKTLDQLLSQIPTLVSTPEIRIDCAEERKFSVIDEVRERLNASGTVFTAIDGVRVELPVGWWLLRASNTGGHLIARAEAATPEQLATLCETLQTQLRLSGIDYHFSLSSSG